jgi:predicted neuraminidase
MHRHDPGVIQAGFLYDVAAFPSCHAATLAETADGVLCSFFGGTHERHPDVCIYAARLPRGSSHFSTPTNVASDEGIPTWNPVLFRPRGGELMLFYKAGPNPREWWGMVKTSSDDGRSWSPAMRLPDGILGPIKNKPIQLDSGRIVSPTSIEYATTPGEQTDPDAPKGGGWDVYFEISDDDGRSFRATKRVRQSPDIKAIQPSILIHSQTRLQAIGRTQKSRRLFTTWSDDAGDTWSEMTLTDLPNCNSGTDAVTLADGRHLLVYNHSDTEKVRFPLNVAISDDGKHWWAGPVLDDEGPEQYSYPCVIQTRDGLVHIAYTWKRRRMKHVVIDPARMKLSRL